MKREEIYGRGFGTFVRRALELPVGRGRKDFLLQSGESAFEADGEGFARLSSD